MASMTSTSPGPHNSKATYSADWSPLGLSSTRSGRWGTNRSVTARPAIFWPSCKGREPSTYPMGQFLTHRASIRVWVGISFNISRVLSGMGDRSGILAPLFSNFRVIAREIPPTPLYEGGRNVKSFPYSGTRSASRGMTSLASRRMEFSQPVWSSMWS